MQYKVLIETEASHDGLTPSKAMVEIALNIRTSKAIVPLAARTVESHLWSWGILYNQLRGSGFGVNFEKLCYKLANFRRDTQS